MVVLDETEHCPIIALAQRTRGDLQGIAMHQQYGRSAPDVKVSCQLARIPAKELGSRAQYCTGRNLQHFLAGLF